MPPRKPRLLLPAALAAAPLLHCFAAWRPLAGRLPPASRRAALPVPDGILPALLEADEAAGDASAVEVAAVVLGSVAFSVALALLVVELVQPAGRRGPPRSAVRELYEKWGAGPPSKGEEESEAQRRFRNEGRLHREDRVQERRARAVASDSMACRDMWAVALHGESQLGCIGSFELPNHIQMATDEPRVGAYRKALKKPLVEGRDVLDVGTGPFCLLSRLALRNGARSADAVEESGQAVEHALRIISAESQGKECQGLREIEASLQPAFPSMQVEEPEGPAALQVQLHPEDRQFRLFRGLSSDVALDKRRYDLVVHEILGHVASSEGAALAILDLCQREVVKPDCIFVPRSAGTHFAPTARIEPSLKERYVGLQHGSELCSLKPLTKYHCTRFDEQSFLAEPQAFEHLDFGPDLELNQEQEVVFRTTRAGAFDGLHFHLVADMDGEHRLDTLAQPTGWRTTYVRLLEEPVHLEAGSEILCRTRAKLDVASPQYSVEVSLPQHGKGPLASFAWSGAT